MVASRLKGRLSLLVLAFAVVMLVFPAMAFAQDGTTSTSAPTIQSDKADYAPGETVILTGSNWQPGESVNIYVNDDEGKTWERNVDVTADENGNIRDQFQLPDWFVAVYKVTATGEQSGVATTSFTDGNVKVRSALNRHFDFTFRGFTGSTTCATGGGTTQTATADSNGQNVASNAGNSVLITANLNANAPNSSSTFQNWSNPNNLNITVGNLNTRTICVEGFGQGTRDLIGNYSGGNAAPVANNDSYNTNEDNALNVAAPGVLSNDTDADGNTLTAIKVSNPSNGSVTLNANGSFTYTPNANYNGSDSFTYKANDGTADSNTATVNITVNAVNDRPTISDITDKTTNEDTSTGAISFTVGDIETAAGNLQVSGSSSDTTLVPNSTIVFGGSGADRTVTITPAANEFGEATITVTVSDGDLNATDTFKVTVNPVNDAPSFQKGADQTKNEDAGAQTVNGWATDISKGPANESDQTLEFLVSNDNNSLFSVQPAVSDSGTLTYTPAPDAYGSAQVTVKLKDNGGMANGGQDTSAPQTFTITVDPVNDAPSFQLKANPDETVLEDAGAQSVSGFVTSFSAGPSNESGQTVSFDVSNNNNSLFSVQPAIDNDGKLTYTPAANAYGSATVKVKAKDDGGTANGGVDESAEQTFTITVDPVNDAPSFTKGADQEVAEDSGPHSVSGWATDISRGPANESGQTLEFIVNNDNNSLFTAQGQPSVASNGTLSYTLAANANGSAEVTLRLKDDGGTANGGVDTSTPQTFKITVTAVNDDPTVKTAAANDTGKNEGALLSTQGAFEDIDDDTLTITKTAGAGTLVDNGNGTWNWSLQTNDNVSGSVTVTASDGKGGTATDTFDYSTVNVDPEATFNAPEQVDEGSNINLSLTNPVDPGSADTFEYAFDCGSGYGAFSANNSASCPTTDDGTRNVGAKIKDDDGGVSEYTAEVKINNVAPAVDAAADQSSDEGEDKSFNLGEFSDPGDDGDWKVSVDWGDGSNDTTFNTSAPGSLGQKAHTYADNGTYTVTVTVAEAGTGDTPSGSDTFKVTVANVAPTVTLDGPNEVEESATEGRLYTFTVSDPGPGDDGAVIDKSCGANGQIKEGSYQYDAQTGEGSFRCIFADGDATSEVSVRATDKDGGSDLNSQKVIIVTVANVDPTISSVGSESPINEGSSSTITVNASDPGDPDPLSYEFDCNNDNLFEAGPQSVNTHQCSFADDGTYTVNVRVTDGDGGEDTDSTQVVVNNVAPAVTAAANQASDEGEDKSFNLGSFSDPGANDNPWSVDVDWGDNSAHTTFSTGSRGELGIQNHKYADDGTYTVSVKVTDKDGDSDTESFTVNVANVAPTVSITDGPTDVNENKNGSESYSFSVSDPGTDGFTVAGGFPDCGTGGSLVADSLTTTASGGSFQCRFSDGPATPKVRMQVRDADEPTGSTTADSNIATRDVTVNNVAPKVNLTGVNEVDEGDEETYYFEITDPGDDTFSFASADFPTCGTHGNLVGTPAIADGQFKCFFPDGDHFTDVAVKVKDDDGGVSTADTEHVEIITVTINNVPPNVTAPANQSSNEGESKSFDLGSFTDPGPDGPWTVDVDWGDGSTHTSFQATSADTLAAQSHTYADNGTYTVKVTVTEAGTNPLSGYATFDVTVNNVAPEVTAAADQSSDEGENHAFDLGSFTDLGANDNPWSVDVDWGDGSPHTIFNADSRGGLGTQNHKYADNGPYTVSVKVTDKNGDSDTESFTVNVANVNPTVARPADDTGLEGTSKTFGLGSFSDPGVNDKPWHVKVTWGDGSPAYEFNTDSQGTLGAANHAYDDNGTYTMSVTVTDKDSDSDTQTSTISIENVAPTGTLGNNGPIDEGGSATVSFTDQYDPSGADRSAGFRYAYRCDGTPFPTAPTYAGAAGGTASTSCPFADNGTKTVRAAIIDKNDGYTVYTTDVVVRNVAPAVTAPATQSSSEGEDKLFSLGSFSDPGPDSPWAVDVDWGDGSAHTIFNETATGPVTARAITAQSHIYKDNGQYTVKVKVTDKDGGSETKSFTINVANVNPTASNPKFVFNPVLGTATASFDFRDDGVLDTHYPFSYFTWSGVGDTANRTASVTEANGAGTATDTRTLNPGCYNLTVTGTAVDDDGGASAPLTIHSNTQQTSVYANAFRPPIMDNERNIAKFGNVVPVKVQLTNLCTGGTVTNVSLYITVAKGTGNEAIEDTNIIAESVSSADTGSQMRVVDGGYIFNLSTRNLSANTDWTVRVRLGSTSGPILLQAVLYPKK